MGCFDTKIFDNFQFEFLLFKLQSFCLSVIALRLIISIMFKFVFLEFLEVFLFVHVSFSREICLHELQMLSVSFSFPFKNCFEMFKCLE